MELPRLNPMSKESLPTIKDVAERVGMDKTTVSRVLNGEGRYSTSTKDRIDKAAAELGFSLNQNAANVARIRNRDAIKGATINDVAERAGVTIGTVSAVINGRDVVAPNTKKRILEAIESLSFSPNSSAQNLAKKKQ